MCHSHSKLAGELLASLLGVVGAIEVLAIDGALGSCHVTADDEVGGAVVLSNDHVLDGLAGSSHFHAVRQVGPSEHGVLLLRLSLQGLVGLDSNQAIDVARLRGAAGGVNQQDGVLHVLLSANQQLEVRSVDRVAVLEGDNLLVFWQSGSHLSRGLRGVSELGQLKAMNPAADVILADLLHEGGNGRVLQTAGAVALLGLHNLVWLPDRRRLQHRHVVPLPLQQELVALLHAIDLGQVESHREAEELLLRQAHVLHDGVVGSLLHEAGQRAEGSAEEAEDVAGLALVQLDGANGAVSELLHIPLVLDHEVHQGASVGCPGEGGPGVDAALRLRLADEASGTLGLMRLHRHRGVGVAEGLVDVSHGSRRAAFDLCIGAAPEGLSKVHLCPGQVGQVAARGLDWGITAEGPVVACVDRDILLVHVVDDVLPGEVRHGIQGPLLIFPNVQLNSLGRLVHAASGDEDVLLALLQRTLERLHLAHEVKVCAVKFFAVSILGDELILRGDPVRHLP
mmetsp:Transcript_51781/g.120805  ORF Transcript_51781/g.120805 Transcript_51781/m.120805 type:complete len:510 (-) Transcript_51781:392-1921(-)